ncbi:MAG TPA: thioesterase domain-containing protein, partial [Terriglobales bacterium]|nr:thioesterase domain-containing protein [Terriglobales bacterium]
GRVWNLYGPTETTIWSMVEEVGKETKKEGKQEAGPVLIGKPIGNTQVYVLDERGEVAPIGVQGELCIAGKGVARGYWRRPELSGEKFVANPFIAGERMYRTGDMARWRGDGRMEYLGRRDQQVKVRGYRIELGEIESVLRQAEGIRECVVVAKEESGGEKRLVGYVKAEEGIKIDAAELKKAAKEKLPEYMVPAAIVEVEEYPLTPNGKIDRRALAAREEKDKPLHTSTQTFVPPQDEIEFQLVRIWERMLNVRPVSVTDNFFELGGHSLLATRLFAQIAKIFGRNLPIATLFQSPTVAELAAVLRRQGWSAPYSSLVPLRTRGSAPPFFCVHSLGANLVSYHALAQHVNDDQPFYGLQPLGLDGKQQPQSTAEEMAAHYVQELRSLQPEGPYYLGGICLGGVVAFEMAQQLKREGEEVAFLGLIDSHLPGTPKHLPDISVLDLGLTRLADWYWGEILLRSPRENTAYIGIRMRNIAARAGRIMKKLGSLFYRPWRQDSFSQVQESVRQANAQVERKYVPQHYPGKAVLFWATRVPLRCYQDRRLGWSEFVEELEVHIVPGNHMSLVDEPNIRVLAEKLSAALQKAQRLAPKAQSQKAGLQIRAASAAAD